MNITTRKFPRTMNEAFPKTFEYGCAVEIYSSRERINAAVFMVTMVAMIVGGAILLLKEF